AASTALPPARRTSRPAWAASGWLVATMPLGAITTERPARPGRGVSRSPARTRGASSNSPTRRKRKTIVLPMIFRDTRGKSRGARPAQGRAEPITGNVVGEGQREQDAEPEQRRAGHQPDQPPAVQDVHEEQRDQQRFPRRDQQADADVQRAGQL